jgi:predicted O-methyltransferase YrrM
VLGLVRLRRMVGDLRAAMAYRLAVERALPLLRESEDACSRRLADCLLSVQQQQASVEERGWIERIERLRGELLESPREISIRFYCGLPPGDETGRIVTRTIGESCRRTSIPRVWGSLLFRLVREFRPAECIELGTSLGLSAAYVAAALEVNRQGRLVTLEGAETLASLARENLERLGLTRVEVRVGRHRDTLPPILRERCTLDFAYIDADHGEEATVQYFEDLQPLVCKGGLIVLDDLHWSPGMERAWSTIAANERLESALDLGRLGICCVRSN